MIVSRKCCRWWDEVAAKDEKERGMGKRGQELGVSGEMKLNRQTRYRTGCPLEAGDEEAEQSVGKRDAQAGTVALVGTSHARP